MGHLHGAEERHPPIAEVRFPLTSNDRSSYSGALGCFLATAREDCHARRMVDWLRFGADMEDLATQTLRTGKQVTGLLGPTVIQPYRGIC